MRPEADDWNPGGRKILSSENLAVIQKTIEEEGPIIVEHLHYYGSRSPDRFVFENLEDFVDYVDEKSVIGDEFHVWSFAAVCRDDNEIARGKVPDKDGCVPRAGSY